MAEPEEIDSKTKVQHLQDMLNTLSAGNTIKADEGRPTLEDLLQLKQCLKNPMWKLSMAVERSKRLC
ncbi:hypothetical protein ARMGADRAFT_1007574 [Armillaria gallica]|uniref:TFIIS N-terminal domain-containing protein n=1 Tax=Armillaria gallica TaxID=47427 RepID=A0A2H3DUM9_ARMGA|nr:hypothetical protein ARMGADRAFT_1007574 [Armillaria gallica]